MAVEWASKLFYEMKIVEVPIRIVQPITMR